MRPETKECNFLNGPIVKYDRKHSGNERRFLAKGKTDQGRHLLVVFTVRRKLVRIVSARDMTRSELREYKLYEEKNP